MKEKLLIEKLQNRFQDQESYEMSSALIRNQYNNSYSNSKRFIMELIQNADESMANKVKFIFKNDYLILINNGKEFIKEDVVQISRAGKSHKKNHFGIGFKSVFKYSSFVYIKSGNYGFRFDSNYYNDIDIPWELKPIWTEDKEISILNDLSLNTKDTIFIFKIKEGFIEKVKEGMNSVFSAYENFIFFNNLEKISFGDHKINRVITKRNKFLNKIKLETKELAVEYLMYKKDEIRFVSVVKDDETSHSKKILKLNLEETKFFNVIKTKEKSGFNFLVDANFILKDDREGFRETEDDANLLIFYKIGEEVPQFIKEMGKLGYSNYLELLLDLEEIEKCVEKENFESLKKSYKDSLMNIQFLKQQKKLKNKNLFIGIEEAIIDEKELYKKEIYNDFLYNDFFECLFEGKSILRDDFNRFKNLLTNHKKYGFSLNKIDYKSTIENLMNIPNFPPSYNLRQNSLFIEYLSKKSLKSIVFDIKMLMDNKKNLRIASELRIERNIENYNFYEIIGEDSLLNVELIKMVASHTSKFNKIGIEEVVTEMIDFNSKKNKIDILKGIKVNTLYWQFISRNFNKLINIQALLKNSPIYFLDGSISNLEYKTKILGEEILFTKGYVPIVDYGELNIFNKCNFISDIYLNGSNQLNMKNLFSKLGIKEKLDDNNSFFKDKLGRRGEELCFNILNDKYGIENVNWVNEEKETGKPYDFVITNKEEKYYYDAKATIAPSSGDIIYLSQNEWEFLLNHPREHKVFRIYVKNNEESFEKWGIDLLIDNIKENSYYPKVAIDIEKDSDGSIKFDITNNRFKSTPRIRNIIEVARGRSYTY